MCYGTKLSSPDSQFQKITDKINGLQVFQRL